MGGGLAKQRCDEAALPVLSDLERRLLDLYQQEFPLCAEPYLAMARQLGCSEEAVLRALRRLLDHGILSRVGVVLKPCCVGVSTLAAMAVPPEALERVAALVNGRPEVNHNYERENRLNLWFVVTADHPAHLEQVLREIEADCRLPVVAMPMEEDFHIDLGFPLDWNRWELPWTHS